MSKKIKQIIGITVVLYCFVLLVIAVLKIWDVWTMETAQDAFLKITYTFGAILVLSLIVLLIGGSSEDKK